MVSQGILDNNFFLLSHEYSISAARCVFCSDMEVIRIIFGRPFLKRFALCYRSIVMSVLSVTFVHCGQTVGPINMKLGVQVCLGPHHIVLDGDPAPPPSKGHNPHPISARICSAKWLHASRCHLVWS